MLDRLLSRRIVAMVIVSGTMAGIAWAQTPDPKPAGAAASAPKPLQPVRTGTASAIIATEDNPGPTVTVEFAGGTAKEFVQAVRNASGQKFNVIMPKEAENEAIPAVSLRDVSAFTALQTLEYAAPATGMYQFQIAPIGNSEDPSRTFAIRYGSRYPTPYPGSSVVQQQQQTRQETRVFSIRDLVEAPGDAANAPEAMASTETIINALRAATQIDSDPKSPVPELMLHKESLLLIARATPEQVRTMESVLQALTSTVMSKRNAATAAAQRARASKIEQAEFQTQIDFNRRQMEEASRDLEIAKQRLEKVRDSATQEKPLITEQQEINNALRMAQDRLNMAVSRQRTMDERAAVNAARAAAGAEPGAASGAFGDGGGEFPVAVSYSFADLKAFDGDVNAICRAIVPYRRDGLESALKINSPGNIVFKATPSEHKILVAALNAMRRTKANEPSLPGQDAAELIKRNEVK